jgi:K+-transporting ATPase ATPase C chain
MKKEIIPSLLLTIVCIVFFSGVYPAIIWGMAQLAPNKGEGILIKDENNGKYYYENIGQKFTDDKYFWSRPSAVNYNAAGSGGSNKSPDNPEYLVQVQATIDTFIKHNPGIRNADIPSDIVTASGSGLDPDISIAAAFVQVPRIARVRKMPENTVRTIVSNNIEKPLCGLLGPEKINVLKLNIALDHFTK